MLRTDDETTRAPVTEEVGDDADQLLLTFLDRHQARCPLCGYDLRKLTRSKCPECRHDLVLSVGVRDLRFGWLLLTIAPGIFSGIAAILLAVPLVIAGVQGAAGMAWSFFVGVDMFGWLSGFAALALIRYRFAFLRSSRRAQGMWAIASWALHLGAFTMVLWALFSW